MAFTDNFNGEPSTVDLASHTPSGGTAWTRVDGAANMAQVSSATNRLINNTTDASGALYVCDDQGSANHYSQCNWQGDQDSGTAFFMANRATNRSNFIGVRARGNPRKIELYKCNAGTFTQLGSTGTTSVAIGATIRLESDGNAHSVYLNGVLEVGPITDAFNNAETRQGIVARTAGTEPFLDDYEAGSLDPGTAVDGQDTTSATQSSVGEAAQTHELAGASVTASSTTSVAQAGALVFVSTLRNNSAAGGPERAAVKANGKVFFGWVDREGTVGVSRFNGQAWRHQLIDDSFAVDIHNNPSVVVADDGHVLVAYCQHQNTDVFVKRSQSPYGLDFGERIALGIATSAAYPNLVKTSDGRIWLFRSNSGGNRPVYYVYSDDDGVTWSSQTQLWNPSSGGNCYYQVTAVGNEIFFICGNGHAHDDAIPYGDIDGFYMRWNGSAWVDVAGGAVTLPETPRAGLRAYEGSTNSESFGFSAFGFKDAGGVYGFYTAGIADSAAAGGYYVCRYVEGAWQQTRFLGVSFTSKPALHPTDLYKCYVVADADATRQVFLAESLDSGQTWSFAQQTNETTGDPIRTVKTIEGGDSSFPFAYEKQVRNTASSWTGTLRSSMAVEHFVDEFLDATTGDESQNWGKQVNTSSASFPVQAHPDDAARRAMRVILTGTDKTRCNRFLPCETPRDAEVLVRWRRESAVSANYTAWVLARQTGEVSNSPGSYWRLGHTNDEIYANVNSETATTAPSALTLQTWYYTRIRLVGATQKARTWLASDSEPVGTWPIDIARSTQDVAGDWGLVGYETDTDVYVDWYALALNGETALFPDFDVTAVSLVIASASHAHAADAQILSAVLNLAVSDAMHSHAADTADLTTLLSLTVQDALHAHSADAVTLGAAYALAIADSMHGHTADSQTLSAALGLVVADALHSHSADALTLDTGTALSIADAAHAHSADGLTLSAALSLVTQSATHGHSAQVVALSAALSLIVAGAVHAHTAEAADLDSGTGLAIQDAAHAHSADVLELSGALALAIQSAVHAHGADSVALSSALTLAIEDALHAHGADNIVWPGTTVAEILRTASVFASGAGSRVTREAFTRVN